MTLTVPVSLVGDELEVPCVDGAQRRYLNLDGAASTNALPAVAARVHEFLPWYSSVHRGAGYKSRAATDAYEHARAAVLRFAGRPVDGTDVAIICRNTTEAINHLAYRLRLSPDDVVVTTVIEHHANLLPWARIARRRFVECAPDGTFTTDDVTAALDGAPHPKLLAITGASNVTGWMPAIDDIAAAAHERGIPVFVDAAQLAPHRRLPSSIDYVAWSGHKMYAPFGAGALVGPRRAFAEGDPFLAGGGAVDLVDLDEVVWTDPPEREEAGSPNVVGAVALQAAIDELDRIGWPLLEQHDDQLARRLRSGLRAIAGVTVLGPGVDTPTLPIATFTVEGVHHALVAARLSANTASASATAASAPTHTSCGSCTFPTTRSTPTATPSDGEIAVGCQAPCGPAPPSPPPPPTSTGSSMPSPSSPATPPLRSPTSKTNARATTGPRTRPQVDRRRPDPRSVLCARLSFPLQRGARP